MLAFIWYYIQIFTTLNNEEISDFLGKNFELKKMQFGR